MTAGCQPSYRHPSAYALVTYVTNAGDAETIWNPRDGWVPDSIQHAGTKVEAWHDESLDVFAPDHEPAIGSRVFEDMSAEYMLLYTNRLAVEAGNPRSLFSQSLKPDVREALLAKSPAARREWSRNLLQNARYVPPQIVKVTGPYVLALRAERESAILRQSALLGETNPQNSSAKGQAAAVGTRRRRRMTK